MVKDRFSLDRTKILLSVLFLCIYLLGAAVQAFYVNVDANQADQENYLARALSLKADFLQNITEGNRMPVYPWLLSFLYRPGLTREDYFRRAKIFNIILSVILLFALYFIFRRYLDGQDAKMLLLIIAFTVFMPRAGYVQCELPFYFLNFCAFLLYWGCLQQPGGRRAAGAGALAGLCYLTKAAALPAVVWFIGCYLMFHLVAPVLKNLAGYLKSTEVTPPGHILKNAVFLFLFGLIFFTTVSPYIRANNKVFGHYFYNVNSTFYIWYDSWDEVVKGTRAHGDREGWPSLPAEEIPTGAKYWREHSWSQISGRLVNGLVLITTNALGGFGYAQYFCIYFAICLLALRQQYRAVVDSLKRNNNFIVVVSLALYFLFYAFIYGFGAAIFKGPRHPLAQYLPALFIMFYFLSRVGFSYYVQKVKCQFNMREVHIAVFCVLVLDLTFQMPYKLYKVFAGW